MALEASLPAPAGDARTVSALTPGQMRALDDRLVDEIGLPLLSMMENAGRNLALAVRKLVPSARRVAVLAGKGNNGGGGLACARHLDTAGRDVHVYPTHPDGELAPAPATQARVLQASDVSLHGPDEGQPEAPDVVVDALIGYAQEGPPRGRVAERVREVQATEVPRIALDVPTGLDPASGAWHTPSLRPDATVTLALPKTGLVRADPPAGRPVLADLGIPRGVYADLGVDPAPFEPGPLTVWTETENNP